MPNLDPTSDHNPDPDPDPDRNADPHPNPDPRYGYKIITAIGVKLTAITPSRGYCIELGSALVVIYGTSQGWPLSTTHCQIGATVGVGLCEGRKGVNGNVLGKAIFGWFITLVVCGVSAAMLVGPNPEPINCA